MKQTKKMITNAYMGEWMKHMPEFNQEINDVSQSLATNTAIIKDFVRKERRSKIRDFGEQITFIPNHFISSEYWNKLKNSMKTTAEVIQHNSKDSMDDVRKPFAGIKDTLHVIFSKRNNFKQNDLDLLVKLAELKQNGIITTKEFNAKKNKILAKI